MPSDDAAPTTSRHSGDWIAPGEEGEVFAPFPPAAINLNGTYAPFAPPSAAVPTSGYATASLILGIATFVTLGLSGILAVIFGHLATRDTKTGTRGGHGMAVAGLILGYVSVAGWVLFLFLLSVGVIGAASSSAAASRTWVGMWA